MIYKIKSKFIDTRDNFFIEKSRGKKVLHIGACDAPYTKEKKEKGLLLHEKLDLVCEELVGIDIDKKGIQVMKDYGFQNIKYFNLNNIARLKNSFDIIIFGETIEHVMNLETTLSNLKSAMNKDTELLISTPNAFFLNNFLLSLRGKEGIHPDHKLIFSYYSLKHLLEENDLHVNEIQYTFLDRKNTKILKRLAKVFIKNYFNILAENIVVSCKKKN